MKKPNDLNEKKHFGNDARWTCNCFLDWIGPKCTFSTQNRYDLFYLTSKQTDPKLLVKVHLNPVQNANPALLFPKCRVQAQNTLHQAGQFYEVMIAH